MEPTNKPEAPDNYLHPGGNIWGAKFPLFGLAVILFFTALIGIRACYLGVPISDVFRNTDPLPTTIDSIQHKQ